MGGELLCITMVCVDVIRSTYFPHEASLYLIFFMKGVCKISHFFLYIHMYVCTYVCTYEIRTCTYVCVYVCMCVCMHMCFQTETKIMIRGKGSVKENKFGKGAQPMPGEDESLHALVIASSPEALKKGVDKVHKHTDIQTDKHTHTRMHAHTHAHTHTHAYMHTHTSTTHTRTHTCIHTQAHTHTHTCMHTRLYLSTCSVHHVDLPLPLPHACTRSRPSLSLALSLLATTMT